MFTYMEILEEECPKCQTPLQLVIKSERIFPPNRSNNRRRDIPLFFLMRSGDIAFTRCTSCDYYRINESRGDRLESENFVRRLQNLPPLPQSEIEQLIVKYPRIHGKGVGGDKFSANDFIEMLVEQYKKDPININKFMEIVDREFLFGCFGHVMKDVKDLNFISDLKVIFYSLVARIANER
jgi:hypothetical protein